MDLLTLIYVTGALALGFLLGITTELLIEVPQVRRLIDRNNLLELENAALKENPKKESPKVVKVTEVVDGTVGAEVDYSKDW